MASSKEKSLSNNNLLIVLVLVTLIVLGATGFLAKILITSILRDTKVVTAQNKADKQLQEDLTNAPQLVESYKGIGPQAGVLADALPIKVDFPSLMVMIENMGADAGMKIKTITPDQVLLNSTGGPTTQTAAADQTGPHPYAFGVNFDGTYGSLQKFMTDIENSARPMKVVSMQLNGSGSALSGEIDMQTYYQDQAQLPLKKDTIK